MFKGTFTALVTPFKDGVVDTKAYNELIERQIAAGIEGILPVGTTGESPTLSNEEHIRVIEIAIRRGKGKTVVLAGTGSNCTREAIDLTQKAQELGADASLLVCPYYNKPSQEGLYQHFMAIAKSTTLPLVLYSIPGRCVIEIAPETLARLARDAKNIVGLKEAGGKPERITQLRKVLPDSFQIMSGDDGQTIPFMKLGATGVISVASNLIPAEVKKMVDYAAQGDMPAAQREEKKLAAIFRDLFIEPNPVPVKEAMAALGWMEPDVRLPLCRMEEKTRKKLFETMSKLGLTAKSDSSS
ncbi:MAG: 4-hydroxy-tetrahydrodipicolinate synthase [Verrucomicrobiota bacterium]